MQKKIILKPIQKRIIEQKLKEAKKKRLIKNIAFDKTISAKNKLKIIKNIITQK